MNNQAKIKAYIKKYYPSIIHETSYGLRRLIIDSSLERYGLDESSDQYHLLSEQIEVAREVLDNRDKKYVARVNHA